MVGAGLRPAEETKPSRVYSRAGQVDTFTLADTVPLARFQVQPVQPARAEFGLRLRRFNEGSGRYEDLRVVPILGAPVRILEVRDLPPGQYEVYVDADGSDQRFEYWRAFFYPGLGVRSTDTPRLHPRGDVWAVDLEIDVPTAPGRYVGHLLLHNSETDRVLTWLPIEISVGQPPLLVRPLNPYLTVGRPGHLTFEVLSPGAGYQWTGRCA